MAAIEAGYEYRPLTVRRDGNKEQPRSSMAQFVSGNYFRIFGLKPAAGRLMPDGGDREGAAVTAMISYEALKNTYNRDPAILGSTFRMNTKPVTIIGVTTEAKVFSTCSKAKLIGSNG